MIDSHLKTNSLRYFLKFVPILVPSHRFRTRYFFLHCMDGHTTLDEMTKFPTNMTFALIRSTVRLHLSELTVTERAMSGDIH
jgi:hypothetical protein